MNNAWGAKSIYTTITWSRIKWWIWMHRVTALNIEKSMGLSFTTARKPLLVITPAPKLKPLLHYWATLALIAYVLLLVASLWMATNDGCETMDR